MFAFAKIIAIAYAYLFVCAPLLFADTVVLKNGQTIEGIILPSTDRKGIIQIKSQSGIVYDIAEDRIARVEFSSDDLPTNLGEATPKIQDPPVTKESLFFRQRINTNGIFAGLTTSAVFGGIQYSIENTRVVKALDWDTGRYVYKEETRNELIPATIVWTAVTGSVVGLIVSSLAYDGASASRKSKRTPQKAFNLHPRLIGKTVLLTVNVALQPFGASVVGVSMHRKYVW